MSKNEQEIMVVSRGILFGDDKKDYFEGFRPHSEVDYEFRILGHYKWMRRGLAEKDTRHKQPIGYTLVANPETGLIFGYMRSLSGEDYSEKRLQGKWSWGLGGHIRRADINDENPIYTSMLREVGEEIEMDGKITRIRPLGYINNDTDSVGQVHFGVLYLIETDSGIVIPKTSEIAEGRLKTLAELDEILSSPRFIVEEWSKIARDPLEQYLFSQ